MDPVSVPVLVIAFAAVIVPFLKKMPFVLAIAIVNIGLFLYSAVLLSTGNRTPLIHDLALQPDSVFGGGAYTLVTHLFLHGSLLHIFGNTIFLVFFGMPLETKIGPKRIAAIYLIAGIGAGILDSLASIYIVNDAQVYRIGASGAIFGIMGAFLALYPTDRILMPLFILIMEAPVWVGVVIYGGFETWLVLMQQNDGIGHMAHAGGLVCGLVFAPLIAGDIAIPKVMIPGALKPLGRGGRAKELVDRIDAEDIPDIREAWLSELVEVARCPKCRGGVEKHGDAIRCRKCSFSAKYLQKQKRRGFLP